MALLHTTVQADKQSILIVEMLVVMTKNGKKVKIKIHENKTKK